jgi:hypothetical protein
MAIFLLASGMQVSLDRHYCCGTLADIKISVTGKMASCGMEQSESSCPGRAIIDRKCCEDQVTFYSISSKYYPEYFRLTLTTSERDIFPLQMGNFISYNSFNPDLINCFYPPGDNLKPRLTQPDLCVLRI